MSCYCPGGCGGIILHISENKGCHIRDYGCLQSSATHINEDARLKIVNAQLMLIFKIV
jgi:hypothetical protein